MESEQCGYSTNLKSRVSFQSLRSDRKINMPLLLLVYSVRMKRNIALSVRGKKEDKLTSREREAAV
jgi:hypothetical protein